MNRETEEKLEEVTDKILDLLDEYRITNKQVVVLCEEILNTAKNYMKKGIEPYAE